MLRVVCSTVLEEPALDRWGNMRRRYDSGPHYGGRGAACLYLNAMKGQAGCHASARNGSPRTEHRLPQEHLHIGGKQRGARLV